MKMNSLRIAAAAPLFVSAACSQAGLIQQYYDMRPAMQRGDWNTAAAQLEKAKEDPYGEGDAVMYWLNMGTILHYAQKPEESNGYLIKAEAKIQELWTTSIGQTAGSMISNDTVQDYAGEDFEKVLLYVYTALNNLKLGKQQDALVEARRADEFLKKMLVAYEKEGEDGTKTVYKQDAFILWLVGMLYEMEGNAQDAYITYKAAYTAYATDYAGNFGMPAPKFLGEDLVRLGTPLGFTEDVEKFKAETGATGESAEKLKENGEVIVIHGNGESPSKRELMFDGQMPDGYVMAIAVPEFVANTPRVAYATVSANGVSANSELAEPITSIVLKNFELRLPGIKAKAVARAIIKYAATKVASAAAGGSDSALGSIIGLAGNIAAAASEAADLRSWTVLPAQFNVARMFLPPGQQTVQVTYHDANGAQLGPTESFQVEVVAGKRNVISVRSMY